MRPIGIWKGFFVWQKTKDRCLEGGH